MSLTQHTPAHFENPIPIPPADRSDVGNDAHRGSVTSLAVADADSDIKNVLASAGTDGIVRVYNHSSGKVGCLLVTQTGVPSRTQTRLLSLIQTRVLSLTLTLTSISDPLYSQLLKSFDCRDGAADEEECSVESVSLCSR